MLIGLRFVAYFRVLFSPRGSFPIGRVRCRHTEKMSLHVSDLNFKMNNVMIKSELDTKEYRVIKLENGLRAILVSDVEHLISLEEEDAGSEVDEEINGERAISENGDDKDDEEEEEEGESLGEKMAACALCVGVGSFSDPPDIPGLAHFLEHMVFMGSVKHPKENAMDEFLKKRGGSNNAVTDFECTTFHIECREAHLASAMDLFAQFFIAPLLMREAMTREREAIDSEFELALPSDGSRFEQLLGTLAPSGHPASCFPWGNKLTLQDRVDDDRLHRAVRDFWLRHYSAHRMTLAVVARLPLDKLEEFVRHSFSDVPNNNLPPLDLTSFRGQPWGPQFSCLLWVKPVYDLCEVALTWVLPPMQDEYEGKPLSYFSTLLGHEGKGSLLAYLKNKVLALKSVSGNDGSGFEFNSVFCTFTVTLELTQEGLLLLDEVLAAVFSYLAMLRENLPSKRCFDEFRDICAANFKYKDEVEGYKYAERLCEGMNLYKPEHYLTGDDLYVMYKPDLLKSVMGLLRPDNVNVAVHCRDKPDDFYDKEEPWFKTKYKLEEIPEAWRKSWIAAQPLPDFFLPEPNPYITRRFTLLESNEVNHPAYPEKILETPLLEVWYRQDLKFARPFAHYNLYLTSSVAKATALNAALLDILAAFLQEKIGEKFYSAYEAGYGWSCTPGDFGLVALFYGYDEKLPLLYEEVLRSIKEVMDNILDPRNQSLFDAVKSDLVRNYNNGFLEPGDLNTIVRLSLLIDRYRTPMDRLAEVEQATLQKLSDFCAEFFSHFRAQILVQGNVTRELAVEIAEKLPSVFNLSPLEARPKVKVWNLDVGKEIFCRIPSFNTGDNNAVITNYYQFGPSGRSLRAMCVIDLVMMLMSEPLFDTLRTQQQIGYDVSCEPRDTFGIVGFSVTIQYQSTKFTADQVDDRIEDFLREFAVKLRTLPAKELDEAKDNLCAMKKVMDTALKDEVTRNFAEITSGDYKFDRLPQEVETIPTVTHEEMCTWLESQIGMGTTRRKVSIQITSNSGFAPSEGKEKYLLNPICPDPERFICDLEEFRRGRQFYPPQRTGSDPSPSPVILP